MRNFSRLRRAYFSFLNPDSRYSWAVFSCLTSVFPSFLFFSICLFAKSSAVSFLLFLLMLTLLGIRLLGIFTSIFQFVVFLLGLLQFDYSASFQLRYILKGRRSANIQLKMSGFLSIQKFVQLIILYVRPTQYKQSTQKRDSFQTEICFNFCSPILDIIKISRTHHS